MRRCMFNTAELIESVQKRPILWNRTTRGFMDKLQRFEAWKEVAAECKFKKPPNLLVKKWKNLKDQLRKELRKSKSDWYLFNSLLFMKDQFPPKDDENDDDDNDETTTSTSTRKKGAKPYISADKLIPLVRVREALWDKEDRSHHNAYKLDKLWDEVAEELQCDRLHVRRKWKNLKDILRKELRKTTSYWKHFEKLDFMFPQFSTVSYFPDEDDEEQNKSDEEDDNMGSEQDHNKSDDDDVRNENSHDIFYEIETKPCVSNIQFSEANTQEVRTGDTFIPSMVNDALDEDVSFFNSLLPHVKKLTCEKKMALRMKIQEIVYKSVYDGK